MSKVIIVRCPRCLLPFNANYAALVENTIQCPHCKCYGMEDEEFFNLQQEITSAIIAQKQKEETNA